MIYAVSDIHGCFDKLLECMSRVTIGDGDRLVFLGDYIDYGPDSLKVVRHVMSLQEKYGKDRVIALRGNHEQFFLEWIDEYRDPAVKAGNIMAYNDWLVTDFESGGKTISSFLTPEQIGTLRETAKSSSLEAISCDAVHMVLNAHKDVIRWMSDLPYFHKEDGIIFVHAGVDEEAGEDWEWGTSEDIFCGKYPPSTGEFCSTVVAGHVSTGNRFLADDRYFHDIFFDGKSHYYIDGSVCSAHGRLLMLAYDGNAFYSVGDGGEMNSVVRYRK